MSQKFKRGDLVRVGNTRNATKLDGKVRARTSTPSGIWYIVHVDGEKDDRTVRGGLLTAR